MLFEINYNHKIIEKNIDNSIIYIIDDFYLSPHDVLEFFLTVPPELHKKDSRPSFNSIYFDDRRHKIISDKIVEVYDYLGNICKQIPGTERNLIVTNFTRFKKTSYNDYTNNYWWPHKDNGYNAILYLNEGDCYSGTNLYNALNAEIEPPINTNEHYAPWRNKIHYELIESIEPKFNRMVMFDGFKFLHGMNICNDDYFDKIYRMNQVFFFKRQ